MKQEFDRFREMDPVTQKAKLARYIERMTVWQDELGQMKVRFKVKIPFPAEHPIWNEDLGTKAATMPRRTDPLQLLVESGVIGGGVPSLQDVVRELLEGGTKSCDTCC